MYDKQGSVLRVETTLNNPSRSRVYRGVRRKGRKVKGWYPLRKGIVDLRRRVQLSRAPMPVIWKLWPWWVSPNRPTACSIRSASR
jgi:hypothetical protein